MIFTVPVHPTYIPFSEDFLSESPYRFRLADDNNIAALMAGLRRSGQTHPLFLEEQDGRLVVLDGHRRCEAVSLIRQTGSWEKILAQVFPANRLSTLDRFRLIRDKNFLNDNPFGLVEAGRFFKSFHSRGLSLQQMAEETARTAHDVEDHIELTRIPETLARLVNGSPISPAFALMLARRHDGWTQTPHAHLADAAAAKILSHVPAGPMSLKSWRFLLDFYWSSGQPFMAHV